MQKVRLKWVKNRGLDHLIDRTTSVRASCLLLDYLARQPSPPVPARSLARFQKPLGLTFPVLRFLRRHPTLFAEQPHPRFPSLPAFSLTPASDTLLSRLARASAVDSHLRLARLLLLTRSRSLPLASILPLRFDLGLPYDFASAFPSAHPDLFAVSNNHISLSTAGHILPQEDIAISSLQRRHAEAITGATYRALSRPPSSSNAPLAFPMRFPRGYGGMKKVKAWMEDFHRLPYISPYDDASGIDPDSDIYEKRNIALLHELLSLMVHKMVRRNAIRLLREELGLPHKFTRLFTRYPGVFYLSLKCKTTTLVLREGYERGKLVEQHPLATVREKVHYVMRTGVLYRGKGLSKLVLDEDDDQEGTLDGDEGFQGPGMDDDADVECFGMEIGDDDGSDRDVDDEHDGYD